MRIAFADITEFVEFGHDGTSDRVRLRESAGVDGQIIREIRQSGGAVHVKLEDRQRSMAFLEKYFNLLEQGGEAGQAEAIEQAWRQRQAEEDTEP